MKLRVLVPVVVAALAFSVAVEAKKARKLHKASATEMKGSLSKEDYQTCIHNCGIMSSRDMTPAQALVMSQAAQEHSACVHDAYKNHSTEEMTLKKALSECAHKYQNAIAGGATVKIETTGETGSIKIEATEPGAGSNTVVTEPVDVEDAFRNEEKKGFDSVRGN